MDKPLQKIDFLLPSLATGGAEKVMLLLARQCQDAGHQVRFIVRRRVADSFVAIAQREFSLAVLEAPKVRHFPMRLAAFYRKEEKPDVIIASLWPLTFLTALVAYWMLPRTKVILVEHGSLRHQVRNKGKSYQLFLRWSLRHSLSWCHRMVTVSEGLRKELETLTGYQGHKLVAIPNPIEAADATGSRPVIPIKPDTAVFLFVGRLKKVKNLPLLLDAFALVQNSKQAELLIVGDGAERARLEIQCRALKIEHQVHFLGFQSPTAPYYAAADVFVLSSDSEGFGNVLVEALLQGCTVVSTDCPYGPAEILENGTYGYLTPVGDAPALAEAMLLALANPIPSEKAKSRGRDFLPAAIFRQYQALIDAE